MREPGFVLSNTLLARQREKTWVLGSGFRLHYYGDKGAGWRVNREWNSKAGAVQDVHVGQPLRSPITSPVRNVPIVDRNASLIRRISPFSPSLPASLSLRAPRSCAR
jgi:hypothetical protein